MFLKRSVIKLRRDDEGMAMVAVVGIMAVGLLLSSLILGSIVNGVGFTSSTRAGVQSQASAEAGLAAATVGLRAGTCAANSGIYKSAVGAVPQYDARIWSQGASGTWTQSCPATGTLAIKIVSGGTAAALGVAGQSAGDKSTVEAIFTTEPQQSQLLELGPAVYAYSSQGYSGSGTLVSADGESASVMVRTGNVTCNGGSSATADLVVNNGDLSIVAGCVINGSVWASGKITVTGGATIAGSVVGADITITNGPSIGGSVYSSGPLTIKSTTLKNGASVIANGVTNLTDATIPGSVWTSGDLTLDGSTPIGGSVRANKVSVVNSGGKVAGSIWSTTSFTSTWSALQNNIYAKTITLGGGNFTGTAIATETFTQTDWQSVTGVIKAKSIVGNGVTFNNAVSAMTFPSSATYKSTKTTLSAAPTITAPEPVKPTTPATPTVPAWPDYKYDASKWSGFTFGTVASPCDVAAFNNAITAANGQKVVLDARACSSPLTIGTCGGCDVNIKNDTAILANAFSFGGSLAFKATENHSLWFITEDKTVDAAPTCSGGAGNFTIGGGATVSNKLDALIYSPCKVTITSGIQWRGQIFAGSTTIDGAAKVTFTAVGLPGVDLSTGLPTTVNTATTVWTLKSTRNLAPGG